MKTTLNIDNDVLKIMRQIASWSGVSLGEVISGYARTQLPRKRKKATVRELSKS